MTWIGDVEWVKQVLSTLKASWCAIVSRPPRSVVELLSRQAIFPTGEGLQFFFFFFFPEGNSWHCRVLGRQVCHVSFHCWQKFRQNVPAASHPNSCRSTHVISFFIVCGATIQKVHFQRRQSLIAHDPMAHPRSVALISHNFRQVFWNDAEICHN